jgi:hypothetical protein
MKVGEVSDAPISELVLSEGRVYGAKYYCVEPIGGNWLDMEMWCLDTFGNSGDMWTAVDKDPIPNSRWYMNDRKFWFRNEKDRTWFIMRWSS